MTRTDEIEIDVILHCTVKRTDTTCPGSRDGPSERESDREITSVWAEVLYDGEPVQATDIFSLARPQDPLEAFAEAALKSRTLQFVIDGAELPDIEPESPDRDEEEPD